MKKVLFFTLILSALFRGAFAGNLKDPFANSPGLIFSLLAKSSSKPYLTNKETKSLIKKSCKKTKLSKISNENGIVVFEEKNVISSSIRVAKFVSKSEVRFQEINFENWTSLTLTTTDKIKDEFYPAGGVTISYFNCDTFKVTNKLNEILSKKRSFSPVDQCKMMNQNSPSNSAVNLKDISDIIDHLSI